jgi:hypothetical protein
MRLRHHLRSLSRFVAHPGGERLLGRVRAGSFALLGLTAAVGLGLTAFIAQVGWPDIGGGPIPPLPAERGVVHRQTLSPGTTVTALASAHASRGGIASATTPISPVASPGSGAGVGGSNEVQEPSPPKAHGGGSSGQGGGGEAPTGQAPASAPVSTPVPEPPVSTPAPTVVASTHGSGKAWGRSKTGHPSPHASAEGDSSPPSSDDGADGDPGNGHDHGHAYGHYGR